MMTTNDEALAAFLARKAEIDALLERIAAASEDHFFVMPDDYAAMLRRLCNAIHREGEYAPDA